LVLTRPNEAFFDCRFVWSADELRGEARYYVYTDSQADPFTAEFVPICRAGAPLLGIVNAVAAIEDPGALVFADATVWSRNHLALSAAGISGDRARVLLYFDADPTGYWDFAKACGQALPEVFKTRALNPRTLWDLRDYLERWNGARVSDGRMAPMPCFAVRDYATVCKANAAAIVEVMRNLADDESRAAYARILFGSNEDILAGYIASVFGPQQYMDIVKLELGDTVVNCGVEKGWELPYFIAKLQGHGRIHNFDPVILWKSTAYAGFIESFADMLTEHRIILGDRDGIVELPMGITNMVRSDEVGAAMAAAGIPTACYISKTLDTVVGEGVVDRVDYLKMDVEGGEILILKGALATIAKFRPKLAVAIYHEATHFWEYPLFLMSNLQDYRFYVRQYGYSRFETLLYAVPAEDGKSRSGSEGLHGAAAEPDRGPRSCLFEYHLRDRQPRSQYFAGGRRVLSRVSGPSWRAGRLEPGPQIDTDDVFAVFESSDRTIYLTRHKFPDEAHYITVGEAAEPIAIDWTVRIRVADAAVCVPVQGPHLSAGFAVYEPRSGAIEIYCYQDRVISPVASIHVEGWPILVESVRADAYDVVHLSPDGDEVLVDSCAIGSRIIRRDTRRYVLGGRFCGLVLVKTYVDGVVHRTQGFAHGKAEDGDLAVSVLHGDRFETAGTVWVDPQFELIPTFHLS
jgi:FkbM family methyltransferase